MHEEIKHYGVKGMKWGVRTSVYTKNKIGDRYTDRQKRKMSKRAVKVLKKQKKNYDVLAKDNQAQANRAYRKADMNKVREYEKRAKKFINYSKSIDRTINAIENGRIKAGKDYVTNSIYSSNLLLDAAGLLNIRSQHRIDYNIK